MRHINKNNPKIRKEALTIILKLIQNQWIDGEYYNFLDDYDQRGNKGADKEKE